MCHSCYWWNGYWFWNIQLALFRWINMWLCLNWSCFFRYNCALFSSLKPLDTSPLCTGFVSSPFSLLYIKLYRERGKEKFYKCWNIHGYQIRFTPWRFRWFSTSPKVWFLSLTFLCHLPAYPYWWYKINLWIRRTVNSNKSHISTFPKLHEK